MGRAVTGDRDRLLSLSNAANFDPYVNSIEHSVRGVSGDFYNSETLNLDLKPLAET
jgi:hypothetical protein